MSKNIFKNFIAYRVAPGAIGVLSAEVALYPAALQEKLEQYVTRDPEGGAWRAQGLSYTQASGHLVSSIGDEIYLMAVQFNERMLPAKVRDEHLAKVVADMEQRQGHKCGKKLYAELREQVEFELLPKAFIRRSTVPVMMMAPDLMLVFASSPKKADDTLSVLRGVFGQDLGARLIEVKDPVASLTSLANDAVVEYLEVGASAVLKGLNKRSFRIKDTDIGSEDVQRLLKQNLDVHEMGLRFYADADGVDEILTFTLNDKLNFKRVEFSDLNNMREAKDGDEARDIFHANAFLVANEYRSLLERIVEAMGGEVLPEPAAEPKVREPVAAIDDDL